VNGKMMFIMARELKHGTLIKLNMKVNFRMAKKLDKEDLNLMEIIMKENLLMVSLMEEENITFKKPIDFILENLKII
jgi:hypothetical protein